MLISNKNNQNFQSGRSMIEMLGVLAIIGILSVGGITGYSKAMEQMKINKTIQQISTIANNVHTTFISQENYGGLNNNTTLWKNAGLIPNDMWIDGETYPQLVWGGEVRLYSRQKDDEDTYNLGAFSLYIGNLKSEQMCIQLLTNNWKDFGVSMIELQNCELSDIYGDGINSEFDLLTPIPVSTAAYLCQIHKDDSDGIDEINIYFDIDVNSEYWQEYLADCSLSDGGC